MLSSVRSSLARSAVICSRRALVKGRAQAGCSDILRASCACRLQTVPRRSIFSFLPRPFGGPSLGPAKSPNNNIIGKQHMERVIIGYSRQKLFDVVIDIDSYSQFLPWCTQSRVLQFNKDSTLDAELRIGFKPFEERYVSRVSFQPAESVLVNVQEGKLFHHLKTTWKFSDGPAPESCLLSFSVDFAFSNALHQKVAEMFFREVASTMTAAFEKRCRHIYGRPTVPLKQLL